MDPRTSKQTPPKDRIDPFRKQVIRPDEKEDQGDSGPDRDNPVTRDSKQPARGSTAR